jgi:RNA polymerase sigma-32 factor
MLSVTLADPGTNRYIATANRVPRVTREEEEVLVARWRGSADRRAADKLVASHLRDVVAIALRFRFYGTPVGELIAEGNLGLLKALEKYDTSFGTRFGTYAAYWIRAYVVGHALRSWSMVGNRSGVMRSKLFFKLRRERARLESMHGVGGDVNTLLAERMNVTETKLAVMLNRMDARDVSLDDPIGDDSRTTLGDQLLGGEDQEQSYAQHQLRQRMTEVLEDALRTLDARERFIVEARLMADHEEELSLADIGRQLGVSRERARQLEKRARDKLRGALNRRPGASTDWLSAAIAG